MNKWNSDGADSVHDFGLGMQPFDCAQDRCSFPEHREGLTEWKGEIGNGVQDFVGKLFARNVVFREMEGNVLNEFHKRIIHFGHIMLYSGKNLATICS